MIANLSNSRKYENAKLFGILVFSLSVAISHVQAIDVSAIRLTADSAVTEVWIDGEKVSLKKNAADWRQADDYGPIKGLKCVAVKAIADGQHAGFMAAIVVDNKQWIVSDRTWKVYAGDPPRDKRGRQWTDPNYDDSSWAYATEVGPYGCGPWGTDKAAVGKAKPQAKLNADFRLEEAPPKKKPVNKKLDGKIPAGTSVTDLLWLFGRAGNKQLWNATWIWGGLGLNPKKEVCFRKVFVGGKGVPPTQPQDPRVTKVTPTGFELQWKQSFSAQGPVTYQVVWNGLPIAESKTTSCSVNGIDIGPAPQNYAYVRAVAPDGTFSVASRFVSLKLPDKEAPSTVPNPRVIREDKNRVYLAWDPASDNVGISSYSLKVGKWMWFAPGNVHAIAVKKNGKVDCGSITIKAKDLDGNFGPVVKFADPKPVTGDPQPPLLIPNGKSDRTVDLKWTPGAPGSCSGYRLEKETGGKWTSVTEVKDPRHGFARVTGLKPDTDYTFRVVALGKGKEAAGKPLTVKTVTPPGKNPKLRFAVILATDGKWQFLEQGLQDAVDAKCAFALVKGQIVPQLSGDPKHWNKVKQVGEKYGKQIKIVFSPLSIKDQWPVVNDPSASWPTEDWGWWTSIGRYDRFLLHVGQPLDQVHQELNGAFQLAALTENPRGNPDFPFDLEQAVQNAEANPRCRWFMTSGITCESYPKGIPGIILQLNRPSIEFMRMINGDRGHEINWQPGCNVVGACPQRNRSRGWYLVDVEDDRVLFTSRTSKNGKAATEAIQEVVYDRRKNVIAPSNLRVPHPAGMATGLLETPKSGPVWTQNRIVSGPAGKPIRIRLLGRSTRGAPLTFTIVKPAQHGTLSGEGDKYTWEPKPGFKGDDYFLYRADDGGALKGNTGWVRIQSGTKRVR